MATSRLNRDKYIQIAKASGISEAITQLHHEMKELEFETFEGSDGYNPQLYEDLKQFREFSVELWNMRLDESA